MTRFFSTLTAVVFLGTGSAFAACPPAASGSMPDAIKANEARILCLQRELSVDTSQRKLEFDFTALQRSVQDLQLQQRLNAIPVSVPPTSAFSP